MNNFVTRWRCRVCYYCYSCGSLCQTTFLRLILFGYEWSTIRLLICFILFCLWHHKQTKQSRDKQALIWEKPRLNIEQISNFLDKLPEKHKEKMWGRHCMGKYVTIDKVGGLLFSVAALCIKIHDRNADPYETSEKDALSKRLEPYTKLIESQIQEKDDPTGLTRDDFDNSLYEWLLLPLSLPKYREKLKCILDENSKLKRTIEEEKQTVELYKQFIY